MRKNKKKIRKLSVSRRKGTVYVNGLGYFREQPSWSEDLPWNFEGTVEILNGKLISYQYS